MRGKQIIYILLLLFVATFFRFNMLEERGLFEWDEGYYIQLAATYRAGFDYLVKKNIAKEEMPSLGEYLLDKGGAPKSVFKDGFTYMLFLASFIFGMNYNTALFLNALLGSLTVIALYFFIRYYLGSLGSFLIALGLALSPYHIAYSRSGYSTIASALFLLCCVYLYLHYLDRKNNAHLFFSGIFLGLSFSCHYVVGIFVLTFFILEAYRFIKRRKFKESVVFFAAFSLPLLILELISQMIKFLISVKVSNPEISREFVTYFQRSWQQIAEAGVGTSIRSDPGYYFRSLLTYEGFALFIFLLVIAAIISRIKKERRTADFSLLLIFVLPFLIISIAASKADRVLPLFVPLLYFIIGYGIRIIKVNKKTVYTILLGAFLINGYRSIDYFNYRSNFDKALDYMRNHQGVKHISDDMFVSRAYVGRNNATDDFFSLYDKEGLISPERIEEFYRDGYNYLLVYDQPYHLNRLTKAALSQEPDFAVPTIGNNRGIFCSDFSLLRDKKRGFSRSIYVYSLGRVIEAIKSNH